MNYLTSCTQRYGEPESTMLHCFHRVISVAQKIVTNKILKQECHVDLHGVERKNCDTSHSFISSLTAQALHIP